MRIAVGLLVCAGLAVGPFALAEPPATAPTAASAAAPAPVSDSPVDPVGPAAPVTPAAPAVLSAPAPSTSSTPAVPVSAGAPAKAATLGATDLSEQREQHFKHEGYTAKMHNGEKMYCRSEASTGSRIPRVSCFSEDALVRSESLNPASQAPSRNCSMRTSIGGATTSGGGSCIP